ncbi:hypothetical protein ElyMa_005874600 [Elysia marginata]|uniref:Uncharacterized protein n=1 Tax=Elysia marginata TaxID=1093978 RepID=A0AAV4G2P3_9GAST|nr:hypothetical protein ElyMa_005874600 [Elysia marginata]
MHCFRLVIVKCCLPHTLYNFRSGDFKWLNKPDSLGSAFILHSRDSSLYQGDNQRPCLVPDQTGLETEESFVNALSRLGPNLISANTFVFSQPILRRPLQVANTSSAAAAVNAITLHSKLSQVMFKSLASQN